MIEKLELLRLAKEARLIRRNAIEHCRPLAAIRRDVLVVRGEIAAAKGAHTAPKAAADQRLLSLGEMDSGLAVDELLQHPELAVRERANGVSVVHDYSATTASCSVDSSATRADAAATISSDEKTRSMLSSRTNLLLVLAMPRRQSTLTRGPKAGGGWICSAVKSTT